jgi:hypothetical protein
MNWVKVTSRRAFTGLLTALMLCVCAWGDAKTDSAELRARLAAAEQQNAELAASLATLKADAAIRAAQQTAASNVAAATATQRAKIATQRSNNANQQRTDANNNNAADAKAARLAVDQAEARATEAKKQTDEAIARINVLAAAANQQHTLVWIAAIGAIGGFLKMLFDEVTRRGIAKEKQEAEGRTDKHRAAELKKIDDLQNSQLGKPEMVAAVKEGNDAILQEYTHTFVHQANNMLMGLQGYLMDVNPKSLVLAQLTKFLDQRAEASAAIEAAAKARKGHL